VPLYIRISKKDQNPEMQRRDLLALGCAKFFEEQISLRKEDRLDLKAQRSTAVMRATSWCESWTGSGAHCASSLSW
jgi:hypothetical protein